MATSSDDAQELFRMGQVREEVFFCLELARVDTPAAASQFDWVLQVEHLVVEDVLDDEAWNAGIVEYAADDNRVVGGIVVAEAVTGVFAAPGELRAAHQSVKEAAVEIVENFLEMVMMTAGGVNMLASTHLAHKAGFGGEVVAGDITAVAGAMRAVDRLTVEFGQQNVGDGMKHGFGRAFQKIGKANVEFGLAQADGVVDGDERVKADVHGWRGRARTELGKGFVENFKKSWGHS